MICKACFQDEAAPGWFQCRFCLSLGLREQREGNPNRVRWVDDLDALAAAVARAGSPSGVCRWSGRTSFGVRSAPGGARGARPAWSTATSGAPGAPGARRTSTRSGTTRWPDHDRTV